MTVLTRATLAVALSLLAGAAPGPAVGGERVRNGRILIDDDYGIIASIRPDGSGRRVLVAGSDFPGGATWSPDKQWIAYGIWGGEGTELHLMTATGEGDRYIRVADSWEWSPDGRYLAYSSTTGMSPVDGCNGIWVLDLETAESREVADAPECGVPLHLEWSPDSREIAFINHDDPEDTDEELDIYKVEVETGLITQLTDAAGVDSAPAWSPDGSWILFWSNRDHVFDDERYNGEVYRMHPDGSDQERVTGNLRRGEGPASWSPDGELIVWTRPVGKPRKGIYPGAAVHLMNADGTGTTRVTDGRRLSSGSARFSPDGRFLLFNGYPSRARDAYDYAVYRSRLDGSHRLRLTRVGTHWSVSDW